MARIRSIKADLSEDLRFENISEPAMLLFLLLKPHADDRGIICIDKLQVIRSKAYTVREDVTIQMVRDRIAELEDCDFIRTFQQGPSNYAALDFSDERIDKPRPGLLPDGPQFHTLQPKKADSGSVANNPALSGNVANGPATTTDGSETIRDTSGTVANDPATTADGGEPIRERSGSVATIRDDSRTFANNPAGEERKGEGEGKDSSSSSAGAYTHTGTPAHVGGPSKARPARPKAPKQATSVGDRKAPQEPLGKSADRAEPVYREPAESSGTDSLPVEPLPLDEALGWYLKSTRLKKNRDELMMTAGLADPKYLELWGKEFNSHLLTEGREDTKVMMDYCSHLSRWLKKQPTHKYPDPKTFKTAKDNAKSSAFTETPSTGGQFAKSGPGADATKTRRSKSNFLDEQH